MAWPPHITVATIVRQADRFLMVEEEIDGELVINQPAGHLEPGETLLEAAVRETLEETAWQVRLEGISGLYQYHAPGPDILYHRICFLATPLQETSQVLDSDIHRCLWLSREALSDRKLRSPLVLRCIDDALQRDPVPLSFISHL